VRRYAAAIRIDPTFAKAHFNLGYALHQQDRWDEAIVQYNAALRLDPKNPAAYAGLGRALVELGRFRDAQNAFRECLKLVPQGDPRGAPEVGQLKRCDHLLAQEARLRAVVEGRETPRDVRETLQFCWLCWVKQRYADAVGLYTRAFALDPKYSENVSAGYRYHAACSAALAAAGRSVERANPGDKERAALRRQALAWLQADLTLLKEQQASRQPAASGLFRSRLRDWQTNPDLTAVRDPAALANLPDDERTGWQRLWAEVEAALQGASAPR
jgi:tetratricopeptide (TPR) repeat protein